MKRLCLFLGVWLLGWGAWAQTVPSGSAQRDSLASLTLHEYFALVVKNHPLVLQARQIDEAALADIRLARGAFDPKALYTYEQKYYDKKNYYNLTDGYVKVPTWIGADLKAGYEENTGQFLSDERTANVGLLYAGISLPVLQGLLIDQRRVVLRQAQLGAKIATAERIKAVNKVLLTAAKDYWEWYFAWENQRLIAEGMRLAQERFDAVKLRVEIGELARIDSVEAKITLQDRQIQYQEALIGLRNARLALSNHLWGDKQEALELSEKVIPALSPADNKLLPRATLDSLQSFARRNHPELLKLRFKLEQLEYDRRWAAEQFKPRLNVNASLMSPQGMPLADMDYAFAQNNHKLGFEVELPLLFRKERGKLQSVKIKQLQTNLESLSANRTVINELEATYNNLVLTENLLGQQASMVDNYQILRAGEVDKFSNGESSLFLVNSRESKLIEGQVKLASLRAKYQKARAELYYAAGVPDWE